MFYDPLEICSQTYLVGPYTELNKWLIVYIFLIGVQEPQHEKIITVSANGSIHSPKFPYTYPRSTVLVWRLVAIEENVLIQLTFDERFGLEDPEDDICK